MKVKYQEHAVFLKPMDEDVKIWRYMDFTKFASLLERKALFFCRSDKLDDRFEGSYSNANEELRDKLPYAFPRENLPSLRLARRELRRFVVINSWSLGHYESAALWKLYVRGNEGIAIQSTFRRLKESLHSQDGEESVFIGAVNYIDYTRDLIREDNIFYPFVHKRRSFSYEKELRALIMKVPDSGGALKDAPDAFQTGAFVDVNLETLIEQVYVSPTAPEWFKDLVAAIMRKFDRNMVPKRSNLDADPIY